MLRLYLPALAGLLNETYKMENTLRAEMENQLQTAAKMKESWYGEASESFQYIMNREMQTGSYQSAYSYVKSLREMLEYFYQTVKQLIARCEQIGEQLKQDAYTEPILGVHEELNLTLNYDYISSLNGDCAMALNSAEKAKKVLKRMMEESSRWINWSNEEDELYYAWKKLQRLEHYCDEFNTLAYKASNLEYEITSEMDRIIALNDEFLMPDTNFATKDMEQRKHDMTTFDEIKEVEITYDIDTVIAIMSKDVETWTVEDCEYIAGAFEQYLQEKDSVGLTAIISGLMNDKRGYYKIENKLFNFSMEDDIFIVKPNQEKIDKITSQISKLKHATAYQTLCNLSKIEEMTVEYHRGDGAFIYVSPWLETKEEAYFVINLCSVNYEQLQKFDSSAKSVVLLEDDSGKKAVKVYVQGIEDILPAKTMESIQKMGYTYEEVATILEENQLNLSYKEYEALSDEDKTHYNEVAQKVMFSMLPPVEQLPSEYSIPIGYDMTLTYSASVKGTVPSEIADTTLEVQKKQLQSISINKENTDLNLGKDSIGIGQKVDVGEDTKVGGALELGGDSVGVAFEIVNEGVVHGLKYKKEIDGTMSAIYYMETKLTEDSSVYSEMKIAKDDDNNSQEWEYIHASAIDRLPEPIQRLLESPFFTLQPMSNAPIKVF